jgi:putative secretion ATPase (PEP-CTERM system associated)
MIKSFFNLTSKPFDLLPNPYFLYLSKTHKKAYTYLEYAVRERSGFILLTGDIGSGKTTLIRSLINKNHESIELARVFNTRVSSEQLIAMINDDFGIPSNSREKTTLLRELNEFLIDQYSKGNKPVLIIDEAQNLTPETLEDVRMLSNLETDNAKLLQIILVGQPELKQTLALPELVQLRQRICFYCHIQPLTQEEVGQYILHRLDIAGNREAVKFSTIAIGLIWKYSRGIPRLINIICDFLMLSAYADETKEIDGVMVRGVIDDLNFEAQYWGGGGQTIGKDDKVLPFVAAPVEEKEAQGDDIKGLLTEIIKRIDALEKKVAPSDAKCQEEISRIQEQSDQTVQEQMQSTEKNIDAFNKDLWPNKTSDAMGASSQEGDPERKKGLFGKLFRAV